MTSYCNECGARAVTVKTGPGRDYQYRRGFIMELPEELEVPTCDACGAMFINGALEDEVRALLKPEHDQSQASHVGFLIEVIRERTGLSNRKIEKACGLTPTYLSHVLAGRREASETLIGLLEAYAVCPSEAVRRLERKSAHDTESVKAALNATANPSRWDQVGEQHLTVCRSICVVVEQGARAA